MRLLLILLLTINLLSAKKIALLIGNSQYSFAPLANPLHDVDGIKNTLNEIGFYSIKVLKNASKSQIEQVLESFTKKAEKENIEIALIYFSGHGMQINNKNYMFPANTTVKRPRDRFKLIDLEQFIESVTFAKYGIVLVDACRDNPLVKYFQNGRRGSIQKGLAQVEPTNEKIVIGFATRMGYTTEDGNGNMSPYAKALANRLKEKDDIRNILGKVADDVSKNYEQYPIYKSTLSSNVCLNGKCFDDHDMGLALIYFAKNGDIYAIRDFLNKGVDVNSKNQHGETALMYASAKKYENIVKLLIRKGANINIQNKLGVTALMWASEEGNKHIVKFLIKSGANINIVDKESKATSLALASYNGHIDIVKMLIKAGANINNCALVGAVTKNHTKIVDILVKAGANIECRNSKGVTPLILASEQGNLNLVKLFIRLGANINARDKRLHASAVMWASQGDKHLDIVKYLIFKGANLNYRWFNHSNNETAIERAKRNLKEHPNGKYNILVKLLIKGK